MISKQETLHPRSNVALNRLGLSHWKRATSEENGQTTRSPIKRTSITNNLVENRLNWFGHVQRRPIDGLVRG